MREDKHLPTSHISAASDVIDMAASLNRRLLLDIAELQRNPYPNVAFHIEEGDMKNGCLVLNTQRYGLIHMTVKIKHDFPLSPPKIKVDSYVDHPNVFNYYICASVLKVNEGYTPAYTLKGIAIQLLSFFSSDSIEQEDGGTVSLNGYKSRYAVGGDHSKAYVCQKCQLGMAQPSSTASQNGVAPHVGGKRPHSVFVEPDTANFQITDSAGMFPEPEVEEPKGMSEPDRKRHLVYIPNLVLRKFAKEVRVGPRKEQNAVPAKSDRQDAIQKAELPPEILVMICNELETEDLLAFAASWSQISRLIVDRDLIRTRELQCFCFKESYLSRKLGVGVAVIKRGRTGTFESEFDLLSQEGFETHRIRLSVQGMRFQHWLPLPISRGHWRKVKSSVPASLGALYADASLASNTQENVIYHFMNDIVVKLNEAGYGDQHSRGSSRSSGTYSSLTHASEKAIESYFHLFHLLLCLATETPGLIASANNLLQNFLQGRTSKSECPSLGHLLVAALISEIEMTDDLVKAIIKEAITRNVVWMLDSRGAGMSELAYLEPSAISEYRLEKTFGASKTSYRLLMFLRLFQLTAVGSPRKPLTQLRDEAFDRHGAPPRGSAKGLAESIKLIHQVNHFPDFLLAMGLKKLPTKETFTSFLRDCVQASVSKGYSKMPYSQGQALALRRRMEPNVEVEEGVIETEWHQVSKSQSFFPGGDSGGRGWRSR